jgi:uncharacterized protein
LKVFLLRPPRKAHPGRFYGKDEGMMRIQVAGLSEGVHHYRFRVGARDLNLGQEFLGEILVRVDLEKIGTQLHLKAAVEATGTFECDRCVTSFEKRLRPSYQMHYVMDQEEFGRYDPAEVQVLSAGHPVVNIADDVRQTLLLSIPLKLLCREDCAGLCPHCAKNLNEDACTCTVERADGRWDTLRRLQSN